MIPQASEAAINSKAITEELHDQVNSYVRLLDEKDKIIEKVILLYNINQTQVKHTTHAQDCHACASKN